MMKAIARRKWLLVSVGVLVLAGGVAGVAVLVLGGEEAIEPITIAEVKEKMNPQTLAAMDEEQRKQTVADVARRLPTLPQEDMLKLASDRSMMLLPLQLSRREIEQLMEPVMEQRAKETVKQAKAYYSLPPDQRRQALAARVEQMRGRRDRFRNAMGGRERGIRDQMRRKFAPRSDKEREQRFMQWSKKVLDKSSAEDRAYIRAYHRELREYMQSNRPPE